MSHKAEKVFMQIGSSVASRPWTSIAVTVLIVFAASAGFFVSLESPKIDQTICGFLITRLRLATVVLSRITGHLRRATSFTYQIS